MRRSRNEAVVAAAIGLLGGTGGGYAINEVMSIGQTVELKEEIARLKEEAEQRLTVDVPNSQEASAAIAKSGRTIRISECKPRQAVHGVACTGILTTTSGSFAGTTQPGVLSFAKIDGTWVQIQ